MASVKNKNTYPEVKVRKSLFKLGYRYRINFKQLPGSPDIVLPKYNSTIFINGCFWHGHENCAKNIKPNSHIDFWLSKIQKNKVRDREVNLQLRKAGWNIIIIWECELRNEKLFKSKIEYLDKVLQAHCQSRTCPR